MSDEKMRAEFEAAAEEHFWLQELRGDYDKAEQVYLDEIVQTAWEFWQLSREALAVELPPKISEFNTDENGFVNPAAAEHDEAIDDCRAAIEAAGVKVKP